MLEVSEDNSWNSFKKITNAIWEIDLERRALRVKWRMRSLHRARNTFLSNENS